MHHPMLGDITKGPGVRIVAVLMLALTGVFLLNSCAGHGPYRKAEEKCGLISLGEANDERAHPDQDSVSCMIQTHAMAAAFQLPENSKGIPRDPDRFSLAFVELGEAIARETRDKQVGKVLASLRNDRQDYVVAFIHGWRHNAEVGDGDVRKLRVLLAYARSFLNSRCVDHGRYCESSLTGVYIGWRGASFVEPGSTGSLVGTIGAAPTFWSRKKESERLGNEARSVLKQISANLDLSSGDHTADKMLVLGHSFGGNMLASALGDEIVDSVSKHREGEYLPAPLGDLVVLINPASEALNWTKIQEALAEKGGRNIVVGSEGGSDRFEKVFAREQRPNYISITSVCDWSASEIKGKDRSSGNVKCDIPTARLFPLGQVAALKWDRERRHTIGHLDPIYERKDKRIRLKEGSRRVGTSHEFITNMGSNSASSFKAASNPALSGCDVVDGWLAKAISRMPGSGRGWDTAYDSVGRNNILWVDRKRGIFTQFRHRLSLSGFRSGELASIAPANSPFWNIRAFDSAIEDHGGYVGYPLWCSLNQLILDDVVSRDAPS